MNTANRRDEMMKNRAKIKKLGKREARKKTSELSAILEIIKNC